MQMFELTSYSHVPLFVDSHPKFTCPKQSVSKTPPLHGAEVRGTGSQAGGGRGGGGGAVHAKDSG